MIAGMLALPLPALLLVSALLTVALAVIGRLLQTKVLNGNKPPVFEDIPFIGGLLKFAKVCSSEACVLARHLAVFEAAAPCSSRPTSHAARVSAQLLLRFHDASRCWLMRAAACTGPHDADEGGLQQPGRGVHGAGGAQAHHLHHRPLRVASLLQCHR